MASNYDNSRSNESSLDHYLKQIATYDVMTKEEEVKHFSDLAAGDEKCMEILVRANLRLVLKIAFKYRNRGLMIHDLVEEGNLGLLQAVKRFDVKKGFRFSTYATWWIRQSIEKAIMDQTRTIRLPAHVIRELSRILKVSDVMIQEHFNSNVSIHDLAEKLGVDKERIERVIRHRYDVMSLDQLLYEDTKTTKEMMIEDDVNPFSSVETNSSLERMREGMALLTRIDRRVLRLRFGLDGRKQRPVMTIANQLGISRDYVQKSVQRSLDIIASYIKEDFERCKDLQEFADERVARIKTKGDAISRRG